ncbi:hypothetical protein AAVH_17990 [Aphelenchoides avenae]|nr:hypothetical protein AAVH_17990 [Aphelenchus avenae]
MASDSEGSVVFVYDSKNDAAKAKKSASEIGLHSGENSFKELSLDSSIFTTEEKEEGELSTTDVESAVGGAELSEESDEQEDEDVVEEEGSELGESDDDHDDHVGDTDEEPTDDNGLKADHQFWVRVSKGIVPFPEDIADGMSQKQKMRYAQKMVKSYGGSEADSDYDPDKPSSSSGESSDDTDAD